MLTIDGSKNEGGGQLVRSAIALSAISGTRVRIYNIRRARKNPGLAAQHLAAIAAVAGTCDAECSGLSRGSDNITFSPGVLKDTRVAVDVGTAGSIPLVVQAWLPVALRCGGSLHVTGGTEVQKSPTIDYFDRVLAQVLRDAGADIRTDIHARGYYPRGGGEVTVQVRQQPISPITPVAHQDEKPCIVSSSSNLPPHVTERQAVAAEKLLHSRVGVSCRIITDCRSGPGTGSSCTVMQGAKGGSALGRRGLPAEEVGETAARAFISEADAPGVADRHLADQLLLPLAFFGGAYTSSVLTSHAETMCWLLSEFGYTVTCRQDAVVEFSA
jgi:RNA 3'-terminal phosphate cyclase (ATP)